MNQYIEIEYQPEWDYWNIWFCLNDQDHREKPPSWLGSDGYWNWFIHDKPQESGKDFNWSEQ